jgi:nitronate monooxygenase
LLVLGEASSSPKNSSIQPVCGIIRANYSATRAFSGKPGRAIRNCYTEAAHKKDSPIPTSYPMQRALTEEMRLKASDENKIDSMQAWAGQAASLAKDINAQDLLRNLWNEVEDKLR